MERFDTAPPHQGPAKGPATPATDDDEPPPLAASASAAKNGGGTPHHQGTQELFEILSVAGPTSPSATGGTAATAAAGTSPPVTPSTPGMSASLTKLRSSAPEYRPRNTPTTTPGSTPAAAGGSTATVAGAALPPPMAQPQHQSSPRGGDHATHHQYRLGAPGGLHPHHHAHHHHHHQSGCGVAGDPSAAGCWVDYMLVVDFEATCEEPSPPGYPAEIIEFPVVVVDTRDRRIVSEFHSFVRPVENPVLSTFCQNLTGICQDDVASAPTLQTVVNRFDRWLSGVIPEGKSFIFATDGPWDMCDFMYEHAVKTFGVEFPEYFYRWIDVKEAFSDFFGCRHGKIHAMLDHFGMKFEGRLHSGIDDARNIARIALALLDSGCAFPTVDEIERSPPRQHLRRLSSQHRPARAPSSSGTSPATAGQLPPPFHLSSPGASSSTVPAHHHQRQSSFDLPPPSSAGPSPPQNAPPLLFNSSPPPQGGAGRPLNGNALRFTPSTPTTAQGATPGANGASAPQYPFSFESMQQQQRTPPDSVAAHGMGPPYGMPSHHHHQHGGGGYGYHHPHHLVATQMPPLAQHHLHQQGYGYGSSGYGGGGYGGGPLRW